MTDLKDWLDTEIEQLHFAVNDYSKARLGDPEVMFPNMESTEELKAKVRLATLKEVRERLKDVTRSAD